MKMSFIKYGTIIAYVITIFLTFKFYVHWPRLTVVALVLIFLLVVSFRSSGTDTHTRLVIALTTLAVGFGLDAWSTAFLSGKSDAGLYIGIGAARGLSWILSFVGLCSVPRKSLGIENL